MLVKLLVTADIALYAIVVPVFEINASHSLDPQWTDHARLHEVRQLASNWVPSACDWPGSERKSA